MTIAPADASPRRRSPVALAQRESPDLRAPPTRISRARYPGPEQQACGATGPRGRADHAPASSSQHASINGPFIIGRPWSCAAGDPRPFRRPAGQGPLAGATGPGGASSLSQATPTARRSDRRALIVLLSVIFLNIAGFGLVIPLLPFFGKSLRRAGLADRHPVLGLLVRAVPGRDRSGADVGPHRPPAGADDHHHRRRPGLCRPGLRPNIWLAFLARFVSGFTSGNISTLQGSLADITKPERPRRQGWGRWARPSRWAS